jgi:hypothetical protein
MKRIIWGSIVFSECVLVGGLLLLPNQYYNEATTIAQYAGYARGSSPFLPALTLTVFGVDLFNAKKKRDKIRDFVPALCRERFNSISLHHFLDVNDNEVGKLIEEYSLLKEQGIPCDYHVVKVLGDFFDER